MKLIYIILNFLILAISVVPVNAQKQSPPEGGEPKDFKLPEKESVSLDNGLKATLVEFGVLPKVTVSVVIQTGNVHEKADEIWLADLTGELMKEGTRNRQAREISEQMASMGGELSINVGTNTTTVSGTVLSEFGPGLVELLADVVKNPSFPESEIDRLKNDLKRQLNVELARPQSQAYEKFSALLYPGHPYGRVFPTEAMIDNFNTNHVKSFYEKNFGALRTHVFAAGKFNKKALEDAIKSSFKDWKEGPEPDIPLADAKAQSHIAIIDRPDAPQSTIQMGLPVPDPSDPDYLPLETMNTLLGGSFASRITSNIREDKGYTYSPRSAIISRYKTAFWSQTADVTTEHTAASLKEINKEIENLQKEAPSKDELEGFQNYQAGIFVLQNSSPQGIIRQLAFLDLHNLDDTYLTERVKRIYNVTPEIVQEMAKKYLDIDKMTIVIVGDKDKVEDQMENHKLVEGK